MELDLFTFGAQIVNFLVLVVLLRIFLYKPVIRAMDERERLIASRLREAEDGHRRAEEQEDSYRRKQQEIEDRRLEILSGARSEAQEHKAELIQEARQGAENSRAKWRRALERQKQDFLATLRLRVGEETYRIARKALRDLADQELEARIAGAFGRQLDGLAEDRRRALSRALEQSSRVVLQSAFPLQEEERTGLQEKLRSLVEVDLAFDHETSEELIGGIELRAGDQRIAFSLRSYLQELEDRMRQAIEEQSEKQEHA